MAIRVALIGTGNCGSLALRQLVNDARFDLTGVWVSSEAKVGKEAGELAGLDATTGITATNDLDAVLTAKPDCVVYCAMGDTRLVEAMADIRRILSLGINVVGSAPGVLQYPWQVVPDKYIGRVEDAAREGDSTIFITGVDPGFATDLLPFALAGTCQSIQQVRTMEIADYASYDGATVMFDVMGFGNAIGDFPILFQPGVLSIAWGTAIRQLAAGLGIEVDEIRDSVEQEPAPEDFDVAAGHIAKGTVAALRFQIEGMVAGQPVIVVEHVTRLRDDLRPDWAQPAQPGGSYRVEITGEPSYVVDVCPTSRNGDHNYAAILAAAGRIVNAIPDVVAAAPGIRTTLDLPLVTGKGLYAASGRAKRRVIAQ
jgi:2,4-diaminopentanoate dehydrogenase